ncbi:hypothetical protein [Marinobacterium rhizophilum]|uniref:hypothetical protein n=1 Tax=Marinobacterium rhizophilum TaxID=420402 RepID=UPI00037F7DBB|nr:hypothetical protein [Marinobacterium rhizophilum]
MVERATLTCLWIGSFVLAMLVVELYIGKTVSIDGLDMLVLLQEDRLDAMKPLFTIYGSYLAGILAFWYAKPFKPAKSDGAERFRFWLAMACAAVFNGWILYMVSRAHFTTGATVMADILSAVQIASWMSVIVAPANAFYFGIKAKPAT